MRIAQVAPLCEAVPPTLYGGTERVVAYLCDSLVALGHDVTLFASAESRTKAHLVPMRRQAIRLDSACLKSDIAAHLAMLDEVRKWNDSFDVLHFHTDLLHFPLFEDIAERTVTTLHGRLDIGDLSEVYLRWPQFPLVSISNHQRKPLRLANWLATIPHGLPEDLLRPCASRPQGYLAFLGRMSPEKRPDRAIAIAKRTGHKLRIAAKVDQADKAYFHEHIEPLLNDAMVEFIGEIGEREKSSFLSNASAVLFPIDWPEPFGLVLIEAMACGTPVIAWRRGAVEEIVDDGLTGFIVDNEDEAVAAIGQLSNIDRQAVRRTFEHRFTARTMAQNYLKLYQRIHKVRVQAAMAEVAHDVRERSSRVVQSARSGERGAQGLLATDA